MAKEFYYHCTTCGKTFNKDRLRYLCDVCEAQNVPDKPPGGILKVVYYYDRLKEQEIVFDQIRESGFIDLLPIEDISSLPPLDIGDTPLYEVVTLDDKDLACRLFLKDDSQNPTFSFKDRASALVSAYAKGNKLGEIVVASTGNAGSSMAGICAAAKQHAYVIIPASAPAAKLTQTMMYGAKLIPVEGSYDECFDLSVEATKAFGWYNRNTAYNPLTIEGKKSVSFELFEQFGQNIPDRIFVPVGDGAILAGVYKGLEDLLKIGIIDKMPVVVAVQASGSSNLIDNIFSNEFLAKPCSTIADSISVDIPRNFYMASGFLKEYDGEWIHIKDEEIIEASKILSRNTGLFSEPAAAAAFAGFLKYLRSDKLDAGSKNVVLLTGSGLKDIPTMSNQLPKIESISPNLTSLRKYLMY